MDYISERDKVIQRWMQVVKEENQMYPAGHDRVVAATTILHDVMRYFDPLPVLARCRQRRYDGVKRSPAIKCMYESGEIHARILLRHYESNFCA
jgi:hypothetical protein